MIKNFNLVLIFGIIFFSLNFMSALTINTTSFNVNSTHLGISGTGNISTTNYQARDTITPQQAGIRNLQTTSYTANSGWFKVLAQAVGSVNVTEIFFSNETVFNSSNTFNSSNVNYNMNLTYLGANCTALTGSVANVTFSLFNMEDNITYINETAYTFKQGNLYVLNSSYQIRDSGNWTLNVSCFSSSGGTTDKDASLWEVAWGTVVVNLINPIVDTSVQIYQFFTFSANVTCSGGECGVLNVTLDPYEVINETCGKLTTCENVTTGQNCENKTVTNCDNICSVESIETCEDITTDNCLEYEVVNGSETDNCLEFEVVKNCTTQEKETCQDVNCTENIVESPRDDSSEPNCEDIVENNCTTEFVCDKMQDIQNDTNVTIPENETNEIINVTNDTNVTIPENKTFSEKPESNETNQIEIPDENSIIKNNQSTIEKPKDLAGEEFVEGDVLETDEGKDLGEKTQDEIGYETHFLLMEQTEKEFKVIFYHDNNGTLPIRVQGNVSYNLAPQAYPEKSSTKIFTGGNKIESDYLENVSLTVELVDGILPQFELHIGKESEVFTFGKVIPKVELKEGNYTLIDREDLKLDVKVDFDSNESIILRGLENETNINVTLGVNSQEDVSTSIIAVQSLNIENATIVLKKTKIVEDIISCADEDFDYKTLKCSNWQYVNVNFAENNNTIQFDVKHFTAYAGGNLTAGQTASLTAWDYNDVGMPNASSNTANVKIANETIEFFADYYLAKNGTKLSSGNCSINFSDSSITNMAYNSTYSYFLYERNFTSNGAYTYAINCSSSYISLSASDSIVIGQFKNGTKGAISTTIGDVPFYTISNNPQQTNNLRGGESQVISWSVNSTGILGKTYDFFVEAIGGFVSYVTSSHVNLTISANDSTSPVFVLTIISPAAVVNGSNVIINANVRDNIQVDSTWANITLPNGSYQFINVGGLPYTYTTPVNLSGVYTVNYYANDSSGNNATATKTFQVAKPANTTINVSVEVGVEVNVTSDVDLIIYVHETDDEIETRENINGSESILLPNVPLDLFFNTTFKNETYSTRINNLNLSSSNGGGISFSNPTISGYLIVYAINTSFAFDNATVEINYNNSGYSYESNLQLYKCDPFNVTSGVCLGTWDDKTTNSNTNWDKDNNKFIYTTTSFSGFAIKQYVAPAVIETPSTNGGGSGGGCAPGYKKTSLKCVKIAEEKIKENITKEKIPGQLFDITFNLDDAIIQTANKLSGVVTFESFGTVPTFVNLTFIVLDESGNEVYRENNNITVTTEEVLRWNYDGLGRLSNGKYTAILETLYNVNVSDEFRQEFEVRKEKRGITGNMIGWVSEDGKWWLTVILGLIVLGILMRVVIKKIRKKRKNKFNKKIKVMKKKIPKNKIIIVKSKRKKKK